MKKWISTLLIASQIYSPTLLATAKIQDADVKSIYDIESAVLSTTGSLTSGSACVSSLGSLAGLATGLYIYDSTNPGYIPADTIVAGLPGSCSAGQVQMSASATHAATGDAINFGGPHSQLINDSKIWMTSVKPAQQLSTAIAKGLVGGGSGSKNYLSTYTASNGSGNVNPGNGNFEQASTNGWSLANSALTNAIPTSVASPGNAFSASSGGLPASGNLSLALLSSGAISGNYSGSLTSSSASVAGDLLISSPFFIDQADQAKVLSISFNYSVLSGLSGLDFSNTSSSSFGIYIYDLVNGAWVQPDNVYNLVQTGGVGFGVASFQTPLNGTQFQLALVNVNASTGSYVMAVDDFFIGPVGNVATPKGVSVTIQEFKSGSGTYILPQSPKPSYIEIEAVGAGAGGGGGQSSAAVGTNGGDTTFGTNLLVAGGGGLVGTSVDGGAGGTATIGAGAFGITIPGTQGNTWASPAIPPYYAVSGSGGNSPYFAGGGSANYQSSGHPGVPNTGGGGGGAGGGNGSGNYGGNGGGSGAYLKAVINSPANSYPFSVGAGGAGGLGGAFNGGAGGSGRIIVREYYNAGSNIATVGPQTTALAPAVTVYTSGSGTYTVPGNPVWLDIEAAGGGGGGSGAGTGGMNAGGNGTATTFGSLFTANGGSGGVGPGQSGLGGLGGTATITAPAYGLALSGGSGGGMGFSNFGAGTAYINGGSGGNNPLGGAAQNGGPSQNGSTASANTGAGGAGGSTGPAAATYTGSGGGAGAYIRGIIANPKSGATYSYQIGSPGSGGSGGASGGSGSAGASGILKITAYYSQTAVVNSGGAPVSVNAKYLGSNSETISASGSPLVYPTKEYDTHNAYNNSTGIYTVPIPGKYRVTLLFQENIGPSTFIYLNIFKNTIQDTVCTFPIPPSVQSWVVQCTATLAVTAGDQISTSAMGSTTLTRTAASVANWITIDKVGN